MARINPNIYEESIVKEGCKKMNFMGRPMKGFIFLKEDATDLDYWLRLALEFNPRVKASKKNKKKGAN